MHLGTLLLFKLGVIRQGVRVVVQKGLFDPLDGLVSICAESSGLRDLAILSFYAQHVPLTDDLSFADKAHEQRAWSRTWNLSLTMIFALSSTFWASEENICLAGLLASSCNEGTRDHCPELEDMPSA